MTKTCTKYDTAKTKICTKCGDEKTLTDFCKKKDCKFGVNSQCKSCVKEYAELHKEEISLWKVKWYQDNRGIELQKSKKRYQDKKVSVLPKSVIKQLRLIKDGIQHKTCGKCKDDKILLDFNKCTRNSDGLNWCCRSCEGILKFCRKDSITIYNRSYYKNRVKTDLNYKLTLRNRQRLNAAIRHDQKVGSAVRDLGCTVPECRAHIEKQFKPGMTWGNWGRYGWHIDHIRPLSSFDLTDRAQFLEACHYTNLQPLWAKDNLSKGAKV